MISEKYLFCNESIYYEYLPLEVVMIFYSWTRCQLQIEFLRNDHTEKYAVLESCNEIPLLDYEVYKV